jgi:hypothetical protein
MCSVNDGRDFSRPMVKADIPVFVSSYEATVPQASLLVQRLYGDLTDHNTVRPAVLATILEGVHRLQLGLTGHSLYGSTFAYSGLKIKDDGDGSIFSRYQDVIMGHVHDAMLQFALAERNLQLVKETLGSFGYDFLHFCDCGHIVARSGADYLETDEYKSMNLVRSYAESIGAPVFHVGSIDDLPLHLIDMHQHEVDGYKRIWQMLGRIGRQAFDGEIAPAFEYLKAMKEGTHGRADHRGQYPIWQAAPTARHCS